MATHVQRWMAVVLAAAGLLVGGCGGGSDDDDSDATGAGGNDAPAGTQVTVVGNEFSFTPDTLTLKAGEPTKIVLENKGTIEHDIVVDDPGFKLTVAPANTGEKTLTIDEPGTYKMYCSVAGHESAGMKGEINVT